MKLGLSGRIAESFQASQITPLLALVAFLLGVFAVVVTPREEEPQIDVTFANVFIPYPGAQASEVESLVATPAEQVLSEIEGIKHVYSVSRPGMAVMTVQFRVGENREDAIVRLFNKIYSNQDWLPQGLGVGQPVIKPKGIDDVPIVSVTLWSNDVTQGAYELGQVAHAIEAELKRVPGTRDIYTLGAPTRAVKVQLDPQALAAYGIGLAELRNALQGANRVKDNISITHDNNEILVQAGTFLSHEADIGQVVVGVHQSRPVFLSDVASVSEGPDIPDSYVWHGSGSADKPAVRDISPAVTIAVAKKPGENAVDIANAVTQRLDDLRGTFIPEGVETTITRDYGATADAKAKKLISKLLFATLSVVLLVMFALGWREAIIVGSAVVVTLAATLFASWAWGFTINRVSLFALIFSIGILVDDAIVIVENIHRHLAMGARNLLESIPIAVDEVGGPTILATFTVIAALLPMAFVTGLMGPYMSPIPINASLGMLISLGVAFIFTPWMTNQLLGKRHQPVVHAEKHHDNLHEFFDWAMSPFLKGKDAQRNRWWLLGGVLFLILASISLTYFHAVVLKMLPFDNKSEFQIVLDMPEGSSLEETARVLNDIGQYISDVPEVIDYQVYAGSASPINFNGLVRQYYLREGANLGDIQVNLVDKSERTRKSHEIALAVRDPVQSIARRYGGNAKIVEVPPGPPVQSPLVAEVYGISYAGQIHEAGKLRRTFESTPDIVDVDDSVELPSDKKIILIDRTRASRLGVSQDSIVQALTTLLNGEDISYIHGEKLKYAVPIRLRVSEAERSDIDQVLNFRLRSVNGTMVPLSEVVSVIDSQREYSIYHKDLLPVVYVTADMAGELDSPLYGMFEISDQLSEGELEQWFFSQPENPYEYTIKWDGEWQVTFETFRDMGIAYAVGLILIYLLVVAQFGSYRVPLIIMAPIPLTIIGIMPGHAIVGAQFTATSMIGMIALAGIIVRNSILLVDFINQEVSRGIDFAAAVVRAAAVRSKPIVLTGVAAMAGAFFILDDPIFSGLAVSLIFGLFVSTVLTLIVIPVVYYGVMYRSIDQFVHDRQRETN